MSKQQLRGVQRRARQLGVTMIESMVAVGIAGTLAAIGGPSLGHFRDKAEVEGRILDLQSALRRARSEATKRGELVTVCALDPASVGAGAPGCAESGKDWSAGWLVFVDRGERGEVGDGDRVLTISQAPTNSGPVLGTLRYMTFRASGELLSMAAHFRFVPPGLPGRDEAVPGSALVCVNKPGKARLSDNGRCHS